MTQVRSGGTNLDVVARIGSQPILLAAATLMILVLGIGSITLWRAYTGNSPEQERAAAAARLLQTRTAQASEQLIEKTKGLETTQQESIDQLQVVQDQLQTVRRLLAAQQTETKRLSEQVGGLTGAVESLRQSFASAQSQETSSPPPARKKTAVRSRAGGKKIAHYRRSKARS
jgi:uncharacterized protein HemX